MLYIGKGMESVLGHKDLSCMEGREKKKSKHKEREWDKTKRMSIGKSDRFGGYSLH